MPNDIIPSSSSLEAFNQRFLTEHENPNRVSAERRFVDYLNTHRKTWLTADITEYRNWLITTYRATNGKPLSPASVQAYLSHVRSRYRNLLESNRLRDELFAANKDKSFVEAKAYVDETIKRIENQLNASQRGAKSTRSYSHADHLRLTAGQTRQLLNAVQEARGNADNAVREFMAIRDYAIITMLLATGIRNAELRALTVSDLRMYDDGKLSLYVREGKGGQSRYIHYGAMLFGLEATEDYLERVMIREGVVYRGLKGPFAAKYEGDKIVAALSDDPMTHDTVNEILKRYPISINGNIRTVDPHDLRRTYARRMYDAGMSIEGIAWQLGHVIKDNAGERPNIQMALRYIGNIGSDERTPEVNPYEE